MWVRGCVGWVQVVSMRRISLQDNGIRCSRLVVLPFFIVGALGVGGDGEEGGGEHG